MSMWTLVKALLLKDLIGFLIGSTLGALFLLGCWIATLCDGAGREGGKKDGRGENTGWRG